jgi:hypothetical protein
MAKVSLLFAPSGDSGPPPEEERGAEEEKERRVSIKHLLIYPKRAIIGVDQYRRGFLGISRNY